MNTLTTTDVLTAVREELAVAAPDIPADAATDAHLRHDLDVDSLAMLEFVARLEYRFGIVVPDEAWTSLATLDDVVDYLRDQS